MEQEDMDDQDLYFWSKSKNSMFHRNVVHHKCAKLGMAHLKTEGSVIKTIHVASEEGEWTEMESARFDDLTPYTIYSVNKRKRWETEDEIGVEIMERTNRFHEGTANVVILERVNLKTFQWQYVPYVRYPKDFLIHCVHSLKKSKEGSSTYERNELNTIYGQPYSHFLEENRKPNRAEQKLAKDSASISKNQNPIAIVAYNFIRAPKNYMRLGWQFFVTSNYGKNFFPSGCGYLKRIADFKDCKNRIRYRHLNFEEDDENENDAFSEEEINSDSDEEIKTHKPTTHYNLANHIIPDSDFIFVKRRKIRRKVVLT